MAYRLLADATVALHAGFLVYLAVGGFLAWRYPRLIWPHVACAAYGLGIVVIGWDCPLTHLENWARVRAGRETLPTSGFIDHYLTGVIYPAEHLRTAQVAVAGSVLVSWVGVAVRRSRAARRRRRSAVEVSHSSDGPR